MTHAASLASSLASTPAAVVEVRVGVVVISPNRLVSEHFKSRHWRRLKERRAVAKALEGWKVPPGPRWHVTMTRVGPALLDGDNLSASFKALRDEVAAWIGIDDRSPLVTWEYDQRVERVLELPAVKARTKRTFAVWAELRIESIRGGPANVVAPTDGGMQCVLAGHTR